MSASIRIVGRTSPDARCVYCRGGAGDLRACNACRALNHAECRAELGRCTTLGCQGQQAAAAREGPIPEPPGFLTELWLTAAGHVLVLLLTTAAAVTLAALLATRDLRWFEAHQRLAAAVVLPAAGWPVALLISLPWLLGLRARAARARALLLAPRPRAARLEIVERFWTDRHGREASYPVLLLTPGADRAIEWHVGELGAPAWAVDLPPQDVTLYGETDDPMLVELADGRLLLLIRS